jgi:hypothetical protein
MKDYTQKIQLQAKKKQSSRQHNTKNRCISTKTLQRKTSNREQEMFDNKYDTS